MQNNNLTKRKTIAFTSTDWNDNPYRRDNNKYGGISYYRLVKPMKALEKKYDVTFYGSDINEKAKGMSNDKFYDWLTKEYDMLIVKMMDNATACQAMIHWAAKNGCILVQDYDDNMLLIREDQPAYKMGYNPGGTKWAYAASMMSLADALIVSTQPIKDYFQDFIVNNFGETKDVYVYPNFNDIRDWKRSKPKNRNVGKIVIGWAGSVTHDADLNLIMPALGRALDKYDHVHLELLGGILQGSLAYLTRTFTKKAKDKVKVIYGTPAWDKYPKLMLSQVWDIAVAPLIDDKFNQAKSHIKWMEYAMMGLPTIASDVYPYSNNIAPGTGLLTKDDEWDANLAHLIENKQEREQIAQNAYEYIKDNLQWKQHAEEYVKIVDELFEKHKDK